MKLKVGLIIHLDDVVNIFFHNRDLRMVRKIWIYPNGEVRSKDFDPNLDVNKYLQDLANGIDPDERISSSVKVILKPLEEEE